VNRELLLERRSSRTGPARPRFQEHLRRLLEALAGGRHFALTRYADGERGVLEASGINSMGTNRGWCYRPALGIGTPALSEDLNAALDHDDPDYYVGISCPCCAPDDHRYYVERLGPARLRGRTTYSNLFANDNWRRLNVDLLATLSRTGRRVVLISNWDKDYRRARSCLPYNEVVVAGASRAEYDRPIETELGVLQGGAALWYCHNRATAAARYRALARANEDAIFLVALGPVANVLVHQMFLANRRNTYLDVGHALDGILFGDASPRGYMAGEPAPVCADMDVELDL
jgi:hypothetical protein